MTNYFVQPNVYTTPMDVDGYEYYDAVVVLSTNSCKLQSVIAYNPSAPLSYLQVFDGYEAPEIFAKPLVILATPPFETKQLDFGSINGLVLNTGCTLVMSMQPHEYVPIEASETDGAFITAFFSDV